MSENLKAETPQTELPPEILDSFARFLSEEIKDFYRSERGKAFYAEWIKRHPEYDQKEKPPG